MISNKKKEYPYNVTRTIIMLNVLLCMVAFLFVGISTACSNDNDITISSLVLTVHDKYVRLDDSGKHYYIYAKDIYSNEYNLEVQDPAKLYEAIDDYGMYEFTIIENTDTILYNDDIIIDYKPL